MEEKKGLKKNLGVATAMAIVVGCVIGSGVFFKPQAIYTATGGAPGLGMIAWIITGLASIAAALTFAEVAIMIPKTGGMVAYLEEIYNPVVGFLAGWVQTILFYPAMTSALAVVCAQQAALFIGDGFTVPLAIGIIILIIFLNSLGSKVGGSVQIIFTVCKLIPLILLMIFGFVKGGGANPIFTPMVGDGLSPAVVLGQLMVAILFAFEGWTNVGAIAGEMKNPGRDHGRLLYYQHLLPLGSSGKRAGGNDSACFCSSPEDLRRCGRQDRFRRHHDIRVWRLQRICIIRLQSGIFPGGGRQFPLQQISGKAE